MGQTLPAERARAVTPEQAAHIVTSSKAFRGQRIASETEAEQLRTQVDDLTRPAPTKWIVARIGTLLTHYFAADIPPNVQEAIAADWVSALRGKPAWAIARACQWWMSAENAARRKRPLPGDIEERIAIEMGPVRVAETVLGLGVIEAPQIGHVEEPRGDAIPIERRREVAQELLGKAAAHARIGRGGEE